MVASDIKTRLKVGMEIHVELATRTKMWTAAPNVAHPDHFDAEPNSLLDPVVIGMPGTLPVMNRAALEMSIMVGLALNCQIAPYCKWDRKSYYYPDLPKNYQISQYDLPICGQGMVMAPVSEEPGAELKPIRIRRAHLEEDAGKLLHEAPGGIRIDHSIVDLNRAGTPLLEIVTEPDFESADQVVAFCNMLRNLCRFLGVSEGIMQKGHMRFEPNINVIIEKDGKTFATPVQEIKNLNSFKALHGSITYELARQVEQWLTDGKVMKMGAKSTRGWDDVRGVTMVQREKEEAHDYRYFPDPDLVPVKVNEPWLSEIRARIPELPLARETRYINELGLSVKDARALTGEREVCYFFEKVLAAGVDAKRGATILLNNLGKRANEAKCLVSELGITPEQIKAVEAMVAANKISSSAADELYGLCCADPKADPAKLAEAKGLMQVSDDSALEAWVEQAMTANPAAVEAVKGGKTSAITSLMGSVMKLSKGKANPKAVQEILHKKLMG